MSHNYFRHYHRGEHLHRSALDGRERALGTPAGAVIATNLTAINASAEAANPAPKEAVAPAIGSKLCKRILFVITEDWFALSHFKPLLAELRALSNEVVVVTNSSGRLHELEALGVRTHALNMERGSIDPSAHYRVRNCLARLIDLERPDIVHAIAMQGMVTTSLALRRVIHRPDAVVFHLTGVGYLGVSRSLLLRILRVLALRSLRWAAREFNTWLVAENSDDISMMVEEGAAALGRSAVIPGAGIDPDFFVVLSPPRNPIPRIALVGRMLWTKGADVLIDAHRLLQERGVQTELALYGTTDPKSRQGIPADALRKWSSLPGVSWHGHVDDIRNVWQSADIAAVPSYSGEGMPRAMLEAAACGRPVVVSDVPGCRQFVRHGIDGLIVPPGDAGALAEALARLAGDAPLRRRLGTAARERVLQGYTVRAVREAVRIAYARCLQDRLPD
ncbi:MAG: glycosyltransferase family 4 protein [Hyphomicrobiaceae bacterium]|nr:MAG: glycosyltransferase family 4 protein [Hyphomicrobiaceae bacterium]